MLPQLTSPLSPPAFNPHEILLGSNEAIAGLDSPAPIPTSEATVSNKAATLSSKLSENAFNWLDTKMNDLRIGKRSMNALALEKQQQSCHQVSRNATVFQFPDTNLPVATTVNAFNHPSNLAAAASLPPQQHKTNEVKQSEKVEPVYAQVVKPSKNHEKPSGKATESR